ncbi:MAG: helix-turn-helix domain-containing protein [Candidatus Falkowbacteria bacterium]
MAKPKVKLCDILTAARQATGLSLESIVKKIRYSASNLSRMEKGVTRSLPAGKLALFAEAYQVDIEVLRPFARTRPCCQDDDYSSRNILPLLKSIVASGIDSVSVCDLKTLLNAQHALRFSLSAATIKAILMDLKGYIN